MMATPVAAIADTAAVNRETVEAESRLCLQQRRVGRPNTYEVAKTYLHRFF